MSARDWTHLFFRIGGIILILITLVVALPKLLLYITAALAFSEPSGTDTITILTLLVVELSPLWIGWMLVRRTDWFVDKAFQSVLRLHEPKASLVESDDTSGRDGFVDAAAVDGVTVEASTDEADDEWELDFPNLHRDDVLAIAMSLMGVWILASALPELVQVIVNYVHMRSVIIDWPLSMLDLIMGGSISDTEPLLFVFMRTALGLWLFFASYRIVKIWSKRQRRPISSAVSSSENDTV